MGSVHRRATLVTAARIKSTMNLVDPFSRLAAPRVHTMGSVRRRATPVTTASGSHTMKIVDHGLTSRLLHRLRRARRLLRRARRLLHRARRLLHRARRLLRRARRLFRRRYPHSILAVPRVRTTGSVRRRATPATTASGSHTMKIVDHGLTSRLLRGEGLRRLLRRVRGGQAAGAPALTTGDGTRATAESTTLAAGTCGSALWAE